MKMKMAFDISYQKIWNNEFRKYNIQYSMKLCTKFCGVFLFEETKLGPGVGLNAFFTYTVVFSLGFTWQEALSMVFICGTINVLITIINIRRMIVIVIPNVLQNAISAGISVFIGYLGIKNLGLLFFMSDASNIVSVNGEVPTIENFPGVVNSVITTDGILLELVVFTNLSVLIGLAAGFIVYGLVSFATGKARGVHPILWVSMGLFILNYIVIAIL